MQSGLSSSLRKFREPRSAHEESDTLPGMDVSTQQLRQRLVMAEAAQVAAASEISRLAAANEELTIAKNAMLADIQVC